MNDKTTILILMNKKRQIKENTQKNNQLEQKHTKNTKK